MFQIGNTLISEEIIENDFVCNLSACKGACCVDGDAGAPLTVEETKILEEVYPKVVPYMRPQGIESVAANGTFVADEFEAGEWETPLVNGAECAYAIFEGDGMVKCAIEAAYNDGKIEWRKPVSCHLYPIRIKAYSRFVAVNYDKWHICNDACSLGKELQVPVYKFVKNALIHRFGKEWYEELETVAQRLRKT
ncbi:MAG: DUF3109 family protein [Flavobacteriaceae bacterium]|nr:DUF3109 family protein [Flavobacteriaceae bacterium]